MGFASRVGAGVASVPIVTAGLVAIGASPVDAWEEDCSAGDSGNIAWHTGTKVRETSAFTPNINWSFASTSTCSPVFPGQHNGIDGTFSMRVQVCNGGVSGGTTFTNLGQIKAIAQGLATGTCFRTQWKPNDAATANEWFQGKVLF